MDNCFRCGNVLDNDCKWCRHCGAVNPNHPDNKESVEILKRSGVKITSSPKNTNSTPNQATTVNDIYTVENKSFNKIAFAFFNLIIFIAFVYYMSQQNEMDSISILLVSSGTYFYFICFQLLFEKAGLPWWGIFIPIFNFYLLSKLAFGSGKAFIIPLLPLILAIICRYLKLYDLLPLIALLLQALKIYPFAFLFCLGRSFGRSGILTMFLWSIIIPTMALSSRHQYEY